MNLERRVCGRFAAALLLCGCLSISCNIQAIPGLAEPSTLAKCCWFVDLIDDVLNSLPVKSSRVPTIRQNPTNFFDGFARAEVRSAHQENNPIHKCKSVGQHKAFHLSVVNS